MTRMVSYQKQKLFTLREHIGSASVFLFFLFSLMCFCFVCLRSVFCVQWRWLVHSVLSDIYLLSYDIDVSYTNMYADLVYYFLMENTLQM